MENTQFESIKKVDTHNHEYWSARDLTPMLGYTKWENFMKVIEKAKLSCESSGHVLADHFPDAGKMVDIGSSSNRDISDYHLSRYACYLVAMNGDPRKSTIAEAQTYFASQTRRQELHDISTQIEKRIRKRDELTEHNKKLMSTASRAGVTDFGKFNNAGYKGLYGGMTIEQIREKKGLHTDDKILDYMGFSELSANDFRATQTEEILRRENIHGQVPADATHYGVGREIRETILRLGNTPPENLKAHENIVKVRKHRVGSNIDI